MFVWLPTSASGRAPGRLWGFRGLRAPGDSRGATRRHGFSGGSKKGLEEKKGSLEWLEEGFFFFFLGGGGVI